VLDDQLILKCDELFLVGQAITDGSHESAAGLYIRDTRHLSIFRITVDGQSLDRLALQPESAASAVIISGNAGGSRSKVDDSWLPARQVLVEQRVELDADLHLRIAVTSYNSRARDATVACEIGADFRDLFDIRGFVVKELGNPLPVEVERNEVVLGYRGIDGLEATTHIHFDRTPAVDVHTTPLGYPVVRASFEADLEEGVPWILSIRIVPRPAAPAENLIKANQPDQYVRPKPRIVTDNPAFNRVVDQCLSDLDMLQTTFPEGSAPAAGIPWYVAPFGRDSLITCLQTHYLDPDRAIETLRLLSAHQGTRIDEWREEEPGKILHEKRYGELARTGAIPHSPYYGTADATPLFLMLFVDMMKWTADPETFRRFIPHVKRAIDWIDHYGDRDGDGFIEYRSFPPGLGEVMHQGWKDSWDSINHTDGRPATGDIALVEVQGYVYSAYVGLAEVLDQFDEPDLADRLRAQADQMRARVEKTFWQQDLGFYAQGLDDDKSPVRAITSNPGHLLFTGLPSEERAATVAERLGQHDMDSGWGVRTLSARAATYNPMSYHNGTVWPHDNSIIAAGMYRYGLADEAHRIATELFAAATSQPLGRLPELYCGFEREELVDSPVSYPVTCSPQAWAAGAIPLLVRCFLGLEPAPDDGRLMIDPSFPDWLNEITIVNLPFRDRVMTLWVRRVGDDYEFESDLPVSRKLTREPSEVVTT
jgi:glycogen debranching enzyme